MEKKLNAMKSTAEMISAKAMLAMSGDEMTKEKALRQIIELSRQIIDLVDGY